MWNKKQVINRTCPECGVDFSSTSCPNCSWQPKDAKLVNLYYCDKCRAQTVHRYKNQRLCIDCYQVEYGKPENYPYPTTSDQTSRFLISMGRKSIYWEKVGKERQDATLKYYADHKAEIDTKLKAVDDKIKKDEPVKIGELIV